MHINDVNLLNRVLLYSVTFCGVLNKKASVRSGREKKILLCPMANIVA